MPSYVYRPLLPAKNSIRLVQILPGEPGSDIYCRLTDYTIRDDQTSGLFEALSYVWGDPNVTKRIYISSTTATTMVPMQHLAYLDVTENLFAALQQLRDRALPRTMWIDAICINQRDLEERASQVRFMARIYSHALRVIVWLGEEQDGSSELLATVEDVASSLQKPTAAILRQSTSDLAEMSDSLEAFFDRAWFRRIWVLQEIASARYIAVTCGSKELPGTVFATDAPPMSNPPSGCLLFKGQMYISVIGELVERFRGYEATDKRDKVYALLGMAADAGVAVLAPDYGKNWSVLLTDLARHILGPLCTLTTLEDESTVYITSTGCALGRLNKVSLSDGWYIDSDTSYSTGPDINPTKWGATWRPESYINPIIEGDIVYLVAGAKRPSVIRPREGYFDVIVIAMQEPVDFCLSSYEAPNEDNDTTWLEFLSCISYSRRQATMIWDWSNNVRPLRTFEPHNILDIHESRARRSMDHVRLLDSVNLGCHGEDAEDPPLTSSVISVTDPQSVGYKTPSKS